MKKTISAILAIILVFALCACGAAKTTADTGYCYESPSYYYEESSDVADYAPAAAYSISGNGSSSSTNSKTTSTDSGTEPSAQNAINPDKIIYSGSASVETTDYDGSIAKLEEMLAQCGGFIESNSFSDSSYYSKSHGSTGGRSASYQLRVPSASFNDMMNGLPALGNVPNSSSSSTNVTSQYYDVQARLDAYLAQEARLIELYDMAETMDDIISIEDRLSEVRYYIESYQSTLNNYDRQVAYSSIYLSIKEVAEYTPTVPVNQSFGEKLVNAIGNGFASALGFIQGFIIVAAESLPTVIVIALIVAVIVIIVRKATAKSRAERKARREAKQAERAAAKAARNGENI